jgi:peptidoglycan/xylan/chitin deacetylase (PgdA/CDA1 family)
MLLVVWSAQPARTPTRPLPWPAGVQPPEPLLTPVFAVPVLMYHRIAELPPTAGPLLRDLTVTPTDFDRQVRYLVQNRCVILTAGQVERAVRLGLALPVRSVALTLDDGYGDDFTEAFPILRRYGLDGTLFLVTGTVDTAGHVSWDEARQMLAV